MDIAATTPPPVTRSRATEREQSIVDVVGELDIASAPDVRGRIARAAADPSRDVVVDLSGVSFVDCAGLSALLGAQENLGHRLSLRGLSHPVAWLVELAGLRATLGTDDGPDTRTEVGAATAEFGITASARSPVDSRAPDVPDERGRGAYPGPAQPARTPTQSQAFAPGLPGRGAAPTAHARAPLALTVMQPGPAADEHASFTSAAHAVITYLQVNAPVDLWLLTRVHGADQVVVASQGAWSPLFQTGTSLPWLESFGLHMVTGRAPALALRTNDVPLYAAATTGRWAEVRSYAGAPLMSDEDEVFGTLCGFSARAGDPRMVQAAVTAQLLGQLLSTILTTQRAAALTGSTIADVRALAAHDPLTGLLNRQGWQAGLARQVRRAEADRTTADIVVIDLDRLTTVNDRHGHHAGDELLRRTAEVLTRSCRSVDLVARPGGDEFAILVVGARVPVHTPLAARIGAGLAVAGIDASVGEAAQAPGEDLWDTWIRADEAMYVQKRLRRALAPSPGAAPESRS